MAIPVVESSSVPFWVASGDNDDVVITAPSGIAVDDLLVAWVGKNDAGFSWSAPAGWTTGVIYFDNSNSCMEVFWKIAVTADTTATDYTFTHSDSTWGTMGGGMLRISGANTTTPFHKTGTATGTTASADCPAVTTTEADCLILRLMTCDDDRYTPNGTPTGVIYADDTDINGDFTIGVAEQDLATAGSSGVGSFTGFTSSEQWCAATVAVAPVAGGTDTEINATKDTLILTEYSANVDAANEIDAGVDALTLTEFSATVELGINIEPGVDTLILTEYQADIIFDVGVDAGIDALTLTEYSANVDAAINISAGFDALTLTEHASSVALDVNIGTGVDALSLTEYAALIYKDISISAGLDNLTLTEYSADIIFDVNIESGIDTLNIVAYSANIIIDKNVTTILDTLIITEHAATVDLGVNVSTGLDTLILTEYSANVALDINLAASLDALILMEYAVSVNLSSGVIPTLYYYKMFG
jgi:hypothetical protein